MRIDIPPWLSIAILASWLGMLAVTILLVVT
jgi:hypothetical protein